MTNDTKPPRASSRRMSHLVNEFLFAKEASGRRPATIECYRLRLGRLVGFLGDPQITSVRAEHVRDWLVGLKRGQGRTTSGIYVDGHRIAAGVFFSWLVHTGTLKLNPMDGVERFLVDRPAPRALRREQIQLLLKSQRRTPIGLRNRAMLAFMYDTGIRVSELTRLRLQDVDLSMGLARIESKTRSVDVVPLSRALCKELECYIRESRPPVMGGGRGFFISRTGEPVSTNAVRLWLRRTKTRAGLDGTRVSPQVIRSSSATHLAAMGASAFEIQRFLRHTTVRMSQRYVNLAALDMANTSPFQSLMREPARRGARSGGFSGIWSRFGVSVPGTRASDAGQLRSFTRS